jgi:hypothetical protein
MPRRLILFGLILLAATLILHAHTVGVATDKATGPLSPGEYYWNPDLSPSGPVVIVVSLPQQIMVVYRNGIQIARSTVSTGAGKKATPTGVFEILQKKEEHYSNIYNNAPMPYMQRLTWTGIAMHAGKLPGYPASKGCVRLPYDFSKRLFTVTKSGGTVIIADDKSPNAQFAANPGLALASKGQSADMQQPLSSLGYQWMPEKSTKGPVAILVSGADKKVYVYRNGILIGRGAFLCNRSLGDHVFTLLNGTTNQPSTMVTGRNALPWMEVDTASSDDSMNPQELGKRLRLAPDFTAKIYDLITPGTNVVVTDESAIPDADSNLNIIAND